MGGSARTTHHTSPGMTHCPPNACRNIYVTQKKLDVSRHAFGKPIDLRRENRARKFPFSAISGTMGHPKRPSTYEQTDSTYFSEVLIIENCTKKKTKNSNAPR
jgi:hypothetical protein